MHGDQTNKQRGKQTNERMSNNKKLELLKVRTHKWQWWRTRTTGCTYTEYWTRVWIEEEMKNNGGGLSVSLCVCEPVCEWILLEAIGLKKLRIVFNFFFSGLEQAKRHHHQLSWWIIICYFSKETTTSVQYILHELMCIWRYCSSSRIIVSHTRWTPLPGMVSRWRKRCQVVRALAHTQHTNYNWLFPNSCHFFFLSFCCHRCCLSCR